MTLFKIRPPVLGWYHQPTPAEGPPTSPTMCPSRAKVDAWARNLGSRGSPLLCLKGISPGQLWPETQDAASWIVKGLSTYVGNWLTELSTPIFNNLLQVENFIVDGPLHTLVDQGGLFTGLYQALWEARFLRQESRDARPLVEALTGWLTGGLLAAEAKEALQKAHVSREPYSTGERYDMMMFFLTLAAQNDSVGPVIVTLDGLDRALGSVPTIRNALIKDLLELVSAAERWSKMGCPIGLAIHVRPETLRILGSYNQKLANKLRDHFLV